MTLEAGQEFETLIDYIRESRGFDFSGYKRPTIVRRLTRRCQELSIDSFAAYQDYLEVHPDEFALLFNQVLINVTEFFRDRPAWDWLAANVIPHIVAKSGNIRVWSAGTSSGEEAYTAAIVFCEALGVDRFLRLVKIYATDIDEEALNKARSGYTLDQMEALDAELRSRYFEQRGERYVFRASLRRAMIFGRHDLMQDAPISRLDLLICRNTLMYFTAEAQGRILARFHYALNDDGYLFLGRAETLLTHPALFSPIDVKQRVFLKVPRLQLRDRVLMQAQTGDGDAATQVMRQIRLRELAVESGPNPHVVVDAFGAIVMANQASRRLFNLKAADIGRPLKDLEFSYKPIDLRSPIDRVFRDRRTVTMAEVEHALADGTPRSFDVQVAPLIDDEGAMLGATITFVDVTQIEQLRGELERSKHEVETANEELETTNTELQTINDELRQRTEEVSQLNEFLRAITGSIELGAIVLDQDLHVQVWNEGAQELWGLRSEEAVGQSLFSLGIGLPTNEIRSMLRSVVKGKPAHDQVVVDAVTRSGRKIKCRLIATTLARGEKDGGGGAVLLMDEAKKAKQ